LRDDEETLQQLRDNKSAPITTEQVKKGYNVLDLEQEGIIPFV
jgi:hypothetical protein